MKRGLPEMNTRTEAVQVAIVGCESTGPFWNGFGGQRWIVSSQDSARNGETRAGQRVREEAAQVATVWNRVWRRFTPDTRGGCSPDRSETIVVVLGSSKGDGANFNRARDPQSHPFHSQFSAPQDL